MRKHEGVIKIQVIGSVQTGKSAVLASIKEMLESYGYCVAIPEREERNNPSAALNHAKIHECPVHDKTVFILTEHTTQPLTSN